MSCDVQNVDADPGAPIGNRYAPEEHVLQRKQRVMDMTARRLRVKSTTQTLLGRISIAYSEH